MPNTWLQLPSTPSADTSQPSYTLQLTPRSHPLSYAQSSYCTISVVDVYALDSYVMLCMVACFVTHPTLLLSFFRFHLLVVLSIISDVAESGKSFPVGSSPYIHLIFLFHPLSQRWISYLMWLVCGWSQTRGTQVDGFFPSAGWYTEVFHYHN